MDETWLYHYELETKQQSLERRHSDSPQPKNFRVQKSAGKVLSSIFGVSPRFLGIKTASSPLIIFQTAKLSARSITYLCWCNWRTFWRKNACRGKVTKGVLFLHDNAPAHRALVTCKKTGLPGLSLSWSPTLFFRFDPVGLPHAHWTEKSIERSPFFFGRGGHCCRGDLVGRTNFLIFFEWLAKVRATG